MKFSSQKSPDLKAGRCPGLILSRPEEASVFVCLRMMNIFVEMKVTRLHFKERKIILVIFTKKGCCWRGLNHNCFVTSKLNRGMTTRVFILTKSVSSLRGVHKSGSIIQMFCLARSSYSTDYRATASWSNFTFPSFLGLVTA